MSELNTSPILDCRKLSKHYGTFPALQEVSLTLPRGRIIGLLGPNGSGKTTLMKLAAGLLVPSSGELQISGRTPGVETKKIVSYLPDREYLPDWMRIRDILRFFADFYPDFDPVKASDMLSRLHLDPAAHLKALSKGTKEKLRLILTMSRSAELYLLDEPIGGVDPAARDYILHTIITNYRESASVILSTHLIHDIEPVLEDVIFLSAGRLVLRDAVDNIREQQGKSVDQLFREVFQC